MTTRHSPRLDTTNWLPGVITATVAYWSGLWFAKELRPGFGLAGIATALVVNWLWLRAGRGAAPYSFSRRDWLIVGSGIAATGTLLGVLHLCLRQAPEAAATLFFTHVIAGWVLWTGFGKTPSGERA